MSNKRLERISDLKQSAKGAIRQEIEEKIQRSFRPGVVRFLLKTHREREWLLQLHSSYNTTYFQEQLNKAIGTNRLGYFIIDSEDVSYPRTLQTTIHTRDRLECTFYSLIMYEGSPVGGMPMWLAHHLANKNRDLFQSPNTRLGQGLRGIGQQPQQSRSIQQVQALGRTQRMMKDISIDTVIHIPEDFKKEDLGWESDNE